MCVCCDVAFYCGVCVRAVCILMWCVWCCILVCGVVVYFSVCVGGCFLAVVFCAVLKLYRMFYV